MVRLGRMGNVFFTYIRITIILFYALVQNISASDVLVEQYLGCFYDNETAWKDGSYRNDTIFEDLTIEKCIENCRNSEGKDWSFARLQNGTNCRCGDELGFQINDSACSTLCSGNSSQFCGGMFHDLVSAYILYAVCPIGNYGTDCDSVCHCNQQTPCYRRNGTCTNGCHGKYTGRNCNVLATVSEQYIGCYRDNGNVRAMEQRNDPNNLNTLQYCLNLCSVNNYSYAGPEFSNECHCGESYDRHGPRNESDCSSKCSGNKNQFCGGANAISVYHSCPTGSYGIRCAKVCNCEGRCHFQNGICQPNRCQSGWTGKTCDMRNCSVANGACDVHETCVAVRPTASSQMSVCRCKTGFYRSTLRGNCTEINECSEIPNVCGVHAKSCSNTEGGYICHCKNGDAVTNSACSYDINECSETPNICGLYSKSCNNTVGGFICHCENGTAIANSSCSNDSPLAASQNVTIIAVIVAVVLLIIIILVIGILLYLRRSHSVPRGILTRNESHNRNSATPSKGVSKRTSSEREAQLYDHFAIYDVVSPAKAVGTKELSGHILSKLSTPGLLDKEFKSVPLEAKEPSNVGKNRNAKGKNRFKNIIPYDHNRVVLDNSGNSAGSDYINASHVTSFNASEKFIATQGPKPETVEDFWRMICQQDAGIIVMITNLTENRKVKCEKYWPDVGNTSHFGDISVKSESEQFWNDYTTRKLLVTRKEKCLNVVQWHYLPWPDHGAPCDVNSFLNFRKRVRKCMTPGKSVVVHCSAGAGRTGCFIAIDSLLEQGKIEGKVDVLVCLKNLRNLRCQMIQTLEQYQFVHRALLFSFTFGETAISNSRFASTLKELQRVNSENGLSALDAQYQILTDTKQDVAGINYSRVSSKSVQKNKIADMDPAFTWGWKSKDAFMTLVPPTTETVHEFYALCREYKCRAIITIDTEKVLDESIFPTNTELKLRGQNIYCEKSSKEDFGYSHKMIERKGADETYANFGQFDVYANTGGDTDRRDFFILHVNESVGKDTIGFRSLFSIYHSLRRLNEDRSNYPVIIISKNGYESTGFCLAALNAFDMSADEKEVDVFQNVQEVRKSRTEFGLSLSAFKELHSTVEQFIGTFRGSNLTFC